MHTYKTGDTSVAKADFLTDVLLAKPYSPTSGGAYNNPKRDDVDDFYGYTLGRMMDAITAHRPIAEHSGALERLQSLGYNGVANTLARVTDPSGTEVSDYAGFYTGDPDAMVEYRHEDVNDNVIKIAFNVCATASCKNDHFEARAAGLLSLINALESQGTAVHIDAFNYSEDYRGNVITWFPVKRAEDPLDLLHLYYTMGRKEGLRRMAFVMEDELNRKGLIGDWWHESGRGTVTERVPSELTHGYDWVWQAGMLSSNRDYIGRDILNKARRDGLIR